MNVEGVPGSSFWGGTRHEERNDSANSSIERVLTLSGVPEARITVPSVWFRMGGSLEQRL